MAVQFMDPWPVLRMPKFCDRGVPPPAMALKVKPVWESRITAEDWVIESVTGTCLPLILTAPE